jgi:hypothetical protein
MPQIPDVSDETVRRLVAEMNDIGVASLPDFLPAHDLQALQALVVAAVARSGGEYVVFTGSEPVGGTVLQALADSAVFASLIRRVYEAGAGRPAPQQRLQQVLRCLAGRTGQRETCLFHFDSYVLTLVLPIVLPQRGGGGRLLIAPNIRQVRTCYPLNLIDKVLVDNRLTQWVLQRRLRSPKTLFRRIEMTAGHLYLFWGYRSLHATEPCDPADIRSTAVFHFADPHAQSALRRRMGRVLV